MKQPRTFLLLGVIVSVLILGIAYASINDVTLKVSGNVVASPDQGNFNVAFSGKPSTSGKGTINASANGKVATMDVSGLTVVNDTATAVFTIANTSTDLKATLTEVDITNDNTDYFTVTASLASNELAAETGTTTLTVNVQLVKLPIDADETAVIGVSFDAQPVNK